MANKLHTEMFMRARAVKVHKNAGSELPRWLMDEWEADKALVRSLARPAQEIVWLRCIEGMRWADVAKASYYSEGTVRAIVRRAMKKLEEIKNGEQG